MGLKICITLSGIRKYKSIIKKKEYDKLFSLVSISFNLDVIEVLISKVLAYYYVSHAGFVSVNNFLKDYDVIKKEITNLNNTKRIYIALNM